MKVSISSIKDKELELSESIPAPSWGMDSPDIKFIDEISFKAKFLRLGNTIVVKVKVILHQMVSCARCLEEVGQRREEDFVLNYNVKDLGDYLEIDKDVRQELLVNFPMKVLCRDDCKGLCSGCGKNLNYEECLCKK